MTDDKKIKSLEGCLLDSVYMTSEDWETYNELKAKAAKWDDPQTQADLELANAVKAMFELPLSYMVPSTYAKSVSSCETLIDWYRERNQDSDHSKPYCLQCRECAFWEFEDSEIGTQAGCVNECIWDDDGNPIDEYAEEYQTGEIICNYKIKRGEN